MEAKKSRMLINFSHLKKPLIKYSSFCSAAIKELFLIAFSFSVWFRWRRGEKGKKLTLIYGRSFMLMWNWPHQMLMFVLTVTVTRSNCAFDSIKKNQFKHDARNGSACCWWAKKNRKHQLVLLTQDDQLCKKLETTIVFLLKPLSSWMKTFYFLAHLQIDHSDFSSRSPQMKYSCGRRFWCWMKHCWNIKQWSPVPSSWC